MVWLVNLYLLLVLARVVDLAIVVAFLAVMFFQDLELFYILNSFNPVLENRSSVWIFLIHSFKKCILSTCWE